MSKLTVAKFIKQRNAENISSEEIIAELIQKINAGELKTKQDPKKVTRYYLKYYKYEPRKKNVNQLDLPLDAREVD